MNHPESDELNNEPDENDESFIETAPSDLDVDMVANEGSIGIEGDTNCMDCMEKKLYMFSDMGLSNSDNKWNTALKKLKTSKFSRRILFQIEGHGNIKRAQEKQYIEGN